MFSDIKSDVIFADFLASAKLDVDPAAVARACYDLTERDDGIMVSNGPQTYHSSVSKGAIFPDNAIGVAMKQGMVFADRYLKENYNVGLADRLIWWVNATRYGGYNSPHVHGKTELVGLYYPKVPEGSGMLSIMRNDGSNYSKLYNEVKKGQFLNVPIEEGRFYIFPGHLWHCVEAHVIEEERMSISMNLFLH